MSRKRFPKMSAEVAAEILDNDLPDGAYFAMAEEMTGLGAGEFADALERNRKDRKKHKCADCNRGFATEFALSDHCRDKGHRPKSEIVKE